jgi:hypothetical protein
VSAPDNPAAFPCTGEGFQNPRYTQKGMTLLQYYAGQALAGICANPQFFGSIMQQEPEAAADFANKTATAMLSHRQQGEV